MLGGVTWPDQVTHVYVNYSEWRRLAKGYEYLAEIDPQSIHQALDRQGRVLFSNKWARVYELR